jgi:hypothetical protein
MAAPHPDWSASYLCSVVALMEAYATSYAEACVDQKCSSCCFLVLLPLADRLQAAGLESDNGEPTACLPVPQGSSGPLCLAGMPGNQNSRVSRASLENKLLKKWGPESEMVKLSLCLTNWALCHEGVGGADVKIHIFLTTALVGGEQSVSHPYHFTPGERAPGTHWTGC